MVCFLYLWLDGCCVSWYKGWFGCCALCLSWEACSFRCVAIGSIFVSLCRCAEFVSRVHPVIVLSALFCIVCSFLMFVSEVMGDQIVFAYSMTGRVIVLYVVASVSFVFPQCVVVRAFIMLIVCVARLCVFCMCVE